MISQVYLELRRIDEHHIVDPIRQRIYAVALHRLRLLLNGEGCLRADVKEVITDILTQSPAITESPAVVRVQTELYLKYGQRMDMLATRNGGLGALIVMPQLLSIRS